MKLAYSSIQIIPQECNIKGRIFFKEGDKSFGLKDATIRQIQGDKKSKTDSNGNYSIIINRNVTIDSKVLISIFHEEYLPRVVHIDLIDLIGKKEVTKDFELIHKSFYDEREENEGIIFSTERVTITGEVVENAKDEIKLSNARVYITNTTHESISDNNGKFKFEFAKDEYNQLDKSIILLVKKFGYKDQILSKNKDKIKDIKDIRVKLDKDTTYAKQTEELEIMNDYIQNMNKYIRSLDETLKLIQEQINKLNILLNEISKDTKEISKIREKVFSIEESVSEIITKMNSNKNDYETKIISQIENKLKNHSKELKDEIVKLKDFIKDEIVQEEKKEEEESIKKINLYISANIFNLYVNTDSSLENYTVNKKIFRPTIINFGFKKLNLTVANFRIKRKDSDFYNFTKIGAGWQIYYSNIFKNEELKLILNFGISYLNWAIKKEDDRKSDFGIYSNVIVVYPIYKFLYLTLQIDFNSVWLLKKELGNSFEIFTLGFGISLVDY